MWWRPKRVDERPDPASPANPASVVPLDMPKVLPLSLKELVAKSDNLRDAGHFAAAADAYRAALEIAPLRTDLQVQRGNMLKDAGSLLEAETVYRHVLQTRVEDADVHLQLAHVLKLLGRRHEALAEYRRAVAIDPLLYSATIELAAAGEAGAQLVRFEAKLRAAL